MNPAKIFELALSRMIRKAELGPGVVLRPWQSLRDDNSWDKDVDLQYPMVDMRFATEAVDAEQVTLTCSGVVMAATLTEDDKDHAIISALYEAVYGVVIGVFKSFINGTGTAYAELLAEIAAIDDSVLYVGGITLDSPGAPESADGTNSLSIGISIHFSYK
jgi:hypothetical protein